MRILYIGFKGKNNTSFRLVSSLDGERLFLTNSFSGVERDIEAMNADYDAAIMFGLDKTLSNTIRIEKRAALHGDTLSTELVIDRMAEQFMKNGINCEISERPTHYLCNDAYYRMLQKTDGRAIFVHIPGSRYMTDELIASIIRSFRRIDNVPLFKTDR